MYYSSNLISYCPYFSAVPSSSRSAMVSLQCPLGLQAFLTLEKLMSFQHLTAIEEHVAASCATVLILLSKTSSLTTIP